MSKHRNRVPLNRPAVLRMTKLFALIKREALDARQLAERFEVSQKCIHRDLDFLRDQMQLPIFWDPHSKAWGVDMKAKLPWWI